MRLAGPVILSQFAANAPVLIATAVMGLLGTAELAAWGYSSSIYYLFFVGLSGVLLAVAPRVADAGGHRTVGGKNAFVGGLHLALMLAAVAFPLMQLLALVMLRERPDGVDADLVATHLRLYSLGMLPVLAIGACRGLLEASGKAHVITAVLWGGVALVAVFSPALSLGWGVLPKMGLAGGALVSGLMPWLMLAVCLPQACKHAGLSVAELRPSVELRAEIARLWRLGWPIGLTLGAEAGLFSVVSLLMRSFGTEALAAHTTVFQIITALFMVPLGLSAATTIRVAQAAGQEGGLAAARRAGFTGIGAAVVIMLSFAAAEMFWPRAFTSLFIAEGADASLIAKAAGLLGIAALFQVVDGVQVASNSALRGLQDTKVPLIISLISYWILGVPAGAFLAFNAGMGAAGLWYGLLIGLVAAAIGQLGRFVALTNRLKA